MHSTANIGECDTCSINIQPTFEKEKLPGKPESLERCQTDLNRRSGSCSPTPYHLAMAPI